MPLQDAIAPLGFLQGVRTDVAATDAGFIDIPHRGRGYVVTAVYVYNASGNVATASLGLFGGPGGTGPVIVADAALTGVTGSTAVSARTPAATATTPAVTADGLYARIGTASGVAGATVDLVVYGYALP